MHYVKSKYKNEVSDAQLLEGALKGMLSNLDKFSEFLTLEDASSFFGGIEGTYKGIGVVISKDETGLISVDRVFKDAPAYNAGVIEGDRILQVDELSVLEWTVEEASKKIKGPEGSKVSLKIMRGHKERDIVITRSDVKVNPVDYRIVDGVGYIKLEQFNLNANSEMDKALVYMKENKINKLILDLRNNPGGEVGQAVGIAKNFVPKGLITRLEFRDPKEKDEDYFSDLESLQYKLVVLVNKNSASASEILSGAIQDTNAGTLVGTVTYGKSKVQKVFPILNKEAFEKNKADANVEIVDVESLSSEMQKKLVDDNIFGWAKISVGEYFTPKGRRIDLKGIEPDEMVENTDTVNASLVNAISPLKKTRKYDVGDEGAEVIQIERLLSLLGYDVDEADSSYDSKTFAAVEKYQREQGIFPYGQSDFVTQEKMNASREALLRKFDLQYLKAMEVVSK